MARDMLEIAGAEWLDGPQGWVLRLDLRRYGRCVVPLEQKPTFNVVGAVAVAADLGGMEPVMPLTIPVFRWPSGASGGGVGVNGTNDAAVFYLYELTLQRELNGTLVAGPVPASDMAAALSVRDRKTANPNANVRVYYRDEINPWA